MNYSIVLFLISSLILTFSDIIDENFFVIGQSFENINSTIDCKGSFDPQSQFSPQCLPASCRRRISDNTFSIDDVEKLLTIAKKGMATRKRMGGPTILDINTGYIRDSSGVENLFLKGNNIFSVDDFSHYGRIIQKLRNEILETFELEEVYFTAPTFITRIDATVPWDPSGNFK
jgi:hypothetical protein